MIIAIFVGFFAGLIAQAISKSNNRSGFIMTTLLGMIGSLFATWLGQLLGWYESGDKAGFLMSVLGAVLILWLFRLLKRLSN